MMKYLIFYMKFQFFNLVQCLCQTAGLVMIRVIVEFNGWHCNKIRYKNERL